MTKSVLFYLELALLLIRMSLVAYGDSSSDSEVDEGGGPEENKNSDVRKLLGLLPPPKGNKSNKQPVRIALPTIAPTNDSDDEEEESPQAKRAKMGGRSSGLTALLPQPKAIPKQLGSGRTTAATTRSMVPYTLSKRKQDSIKLEKAKSMKGKVAASKGKPQASGDGSDSDEEPVSFFSHLEETTTAEDAKASTHTSVVSLSISPLITAATTVSTTSPAASAYSSVSVSGPSPSTVHSSPYVSIDSTASTTTSSLSQPNSHTNSDTSHYSWEQHTRNTVHPVIAPYAAQPFTAATYQPQYYDGRGADFSTGLDGADAPVSQSDSEGGGVGTEGGGLVGGTGPGITIDPESLRRLAGGSKKRRGREEALNNIMDVMGDDVMEDIKIYQRHYGEDPSIKKLYKPDPSKLKTPTGQQKRKHQITWLAHEAKEKELELQKQWASSNQARRDARTKYGF